MLSKTLQDGLNDYGIGAKIRALRPKKKIGLVDLGKHTGLSPALLSKIERGRLQPEELLGRPFLDFVHPDDREATVAEIETLRGGLPTVDFENRYRCQDGSWRWLSWRTQPVVEENLLYATARDITERKLAEQSR